MMKFVFALVVLLHFCNTAHIPDFNLNTEIMGRLEDLSKLKESVPTPYNVPGRKMWHNAYSCVNDFVRELRKLLKNVTVTERNEKILDGLNANLNRLERPQEHNLNTNPLCLMEKRTSASSSPFQQYINFIKKLNSSRKQ